MSLPLFLWDKNKEKGIQGSLVNSALLGEFLPDYISKEKRFIYPHPSDDKGFYIKGGTYISMPVNDAALGSRNLIFGSRNDINVTVMESYLDEGYYFAGGKDYYIYLCLVEPSGANKLYSTRFRVSLNPEAPKNYTKNNSKCIGGFHTLCKNMSVVREGHPLSNRPEGDPLPYSFWDLGHRPVCNPEGMVYIDSVNTWVDIYLTSGTGENTKSVYGGVINLTDTYYQAIRNLWSVGKRLLSVEEFMCAAAGSNYKTAAATIATTTGGNFDTNDRRMVSNYGLEDCCGLYWQYLRDTSYGNITSWYEQVDNQGSVINTACMIAGGMHGFPDKSGPACLSAASITDSNTGITAIRGCCRPM